MQLSDHFLTDGEPYQMWNFISCWVLTIFNHRTSDTTILGFKLCSLKLNSSYDGLGSSIPLICWKSTLLVSTEDIVSLTYTSWWFKHWAPQNISVYLPLVSFTQFLAPRNTYYTMVSNLMPNHSVNDDLVQILIIQKHLLFPLLKYMASILRYKDNKWTMSTHSLLEANLMSYWLAHIFVQTICSKCVSV